MRHEDVHQQDREGHALGHIGVGTQQDREDTAAGGEDDLAPLGDGRGGVVGRHEDRSQQDAAREQLIQRIGAYDERHQSRRTEIDAGDDRADDPADHQIDAAEQQRRGADLADRAAAAADQ